MRSGCLTKRSRATRSCVSAGPWSISIRGMFCSTRRARHKTAGGLNSRRLRSGRRSIGSPSSAASFACSARSRPSFLMRRSVWRSDPFCRTEPLPGGVTTSKIRRSNMTKRRNSGHTPVTGSSDAGRNFTVPTNPARTPIAARALPILTRSSMTFRSRSMTSAAIAIASATTASSTARRLQLLSSDTCQGFQWRCDFEGQHQTQLFFERRRLSTSVHR